MPSVAVRRFHDQLCGAYGAAREKMEGIVREFSYGCSRLTACLDQPKHIPSRAYKIIEAIFCDDREEVSRLCGSIIKKCKSELHWQREKEKAAKNRDYKPVFFRPE
jgi:hypothetical protein